MKRLALTKDGRMTYCTASEENVGKGRCNHIAHQNTGETVEDFCKRAENVKIENNNEKIKRIKNLDIDNKINLFEFGEITDEELDFLVNDEDILIRVYVANYGREKDLDFLINDPSWAVRGTIAKHGKDKYLDILVNDEDYHVRAIVAYRRRDKDLDVLVYDKDENVRREVANHGRDKDLDILINDPSWYVREKVAEHGRVQDKEILFNDKHVAVRDSVVKNCDKNSEIDNKILDIAVNDKEDRIRTSVAEIGRDKDLDILINDNYYIVRGEVARHGRIQDLNILINDKEEYVREIVAKKTSNQEHLNSLINSRDSRVRYEVIYNPNFKGDKRLVTTKGRLEIIKENKNKEAIKTIIAGPKTKEIKLALLDSEIVKPEEYLTDKNIKVQKKAREILLKNKNKN